jgi:EF hand/EF-hand domain pair
VADRPDPGGIPIPRHPAARIRRAYKLRQQPAETPGPWTARGFFFVAVKPPSPITLRLLQAVTSRPQMALIGLLGVATPALAATKTGHATPFDTDNDGTIDIDEAKKAAGALFDKLDTDKDGTLDIKELKGRLTQKKFTAADPDNDGTLSKDEYLAVVEMRFKAADPDNDGTVSAAELKTAAGRSLSRLLS